MNLKKVLLYWTSVVENLKLKDTLEIHCGIDNFLDNWCDLAIKKLFSS